MAAEAKSRILYILKFLWENTDEEHYVTTSDVIKYLEGIWSSVKI